MFTRRDIPPLVLLLIIIISVFVTLSEVLVLSRSGQRKPSPLQMWQQEQQRSLRSVDRSLLEVFSADHRHAARFWLRLQRDQGVYTIMRLVERSRQGSDAAVVGRRIRELRDIKDSGSDDSTRQASRLSDVMMDSDHPLPTNTCVVDNFTDIEFHKPKLGGIWYPRDCIARQRLVVIIPFRDRAEHLAKLMTNLQPMLQAHKLHYRIYVVEQAGQETFNKARVMNAGFLEAVRGERPDCVVFHDVDMLPLSPRLSYSCRHFPTHLSPAVDKFDFRLPYKELVGGVLCMTPRQFITVNGYSNMYWGWGAEDDDMYYRIKASGLRVLRPADTVARFTMIKHEGRPASKWLIKHRLLAFAPHRYRVEGINSLKYRVVSTSLQDLYTHVLLDVGKPPKYAAEQSSNK